MGANKIEWTYKNKSSRKKPLLIEKTSQKTWSEEFNLAALEKYEVDKRK